MCIVIQAESFLGFANSNYLLSFLGPLFRTWMWYHPFGGSDFLVSKSPIFTVDRISLPESML